MHFFLSLPLLDLMGFRRFPSLQESCPGLWWPYLNDGGILTMDKLHGVSRRMQRSGTVVWHRYESWLSCERLSLLLLGYFSPCCLLNNVACCRTQMAFIWVFLQELISGKGIFKGLEEGDGFFTVNVVLFASSVLALTAFLAIQGTDDYTKKDMSWGLDSRFFFGSLLLAHAC